MNFLKSKFFPILTIFTLIFTLSACSNDVNTDSSSIVNSATQSSSINESSDSNSNLENEPNSDDEEINILLKQSDVLSEHLIKYAIYQYNIVDDNKIIENLNIDSLSNDEIYRFIVTNFIYEENTIHPYASYTKHIEKSSDDYVAYSLKDVQLIVHKFFNTENWFCETYDYDEEQQVFIIPTDAGFGNNINIENISSSYIKESNSIVSRIKITSGSMGENGNTPTEIGELIVEFNVTNDNQKTFLSFSKIRNS